MKIKIANIPASLITTGDKARTNSANSINTDAYTDTNTNKPILVPDLPVPSGVYKANLVFQGMKMHQLKPEDSEYLTVLNSPEYGLTRKVDGASYTLVKDCLGKPHLYSGSISKKDGKPIDKIDNVPHIKDFILKCLPVNSQLIGEINYNYDWKTKQEMPHSKSTYVTSIMGCLPDLAIRRQKETYPIRVFLFDVLFWEGEEIAAQDFEDRYNKLSEIFASFDEEYKNFLTMSTLYKKNKAEVLQEWFTTGEEGGVLKLLKSNRKYNAKYHLRAAEEPAYRPKGIQYKIKTIDTADCVIMDVLSPAKEYLGKNADTYEFRDPETGEAVNRLWALGMAGAFSIGLYDKNGNLNSIGTVASGMDDSVRLAAANNPSNYIGKVIEVSMMSKDKEAQTFRHPVFIGFREDKKAKDCTFETEFH